jgi:MFS family permease
MPREAWVLFAGAFVNRLGGFTMPFLTLYLVGQGYGAPAAGFAIGAYGIGGIGAQAAGGLIADRLGRRLAIAISMFGCAGLVLSLAWVHTLALIVPIMAAFGFTAELYRPASSALITDLVPSERRVTAFTVYRLFINVGWAIGLALGGFVAERSFTLLFVADALSSVAFGIIALIALPHGVRSSRHDERDLPTARRSILADRGFLLFLGAILVTAIVYAQNVATMPLHITAAGHPASTYGLLQALNGALIVLIELPVTAWTQRRRKTSMVALGGVLIGAAFASLAVATSIAALVAMIVVWTLGEIVESPVSAAFVADRAPEHARGRYQSAFGSMYGLAWTIGPILGTAVYQADPTALWIACGVLGIVAALLALAAGRRPAPTDRSPGTGTVSAQEGPR